MPESMSSLETISLTYFTTNMITLTCLSSFYKHHSLVIHVFQHSDCHFHRIRTCLQMNLKRVRSLSEFRGTHLPYYPPRSPHPILFYMNTKIKATPNYDHLPIIFC
ncbi:unnamed protein product [Haemonchus placei]|uniref:Ovule protein n=1 Tax=Haemonchus placei TaxID=6290 RepID=A0A158QQX2_HAEPC|nr:unnamed protein product [Haemonchus placei]